MTVGASKGHARIVPRAATDNQAVEPVVPPPRITARGERAHAVPEQQKGQPGEAGGKKLDHLTQVLQNPFGALALGPKPAQIALAADAVAVAAVMLLLSYVQLTTLAADTVALKSELTVLQAENVSLTAQHEQMFDMATVKEVAAAAGMAKPTSSQITYLDLDSEDSAVVYRTETPSVFSRILSSLHHGVYAVVEYFD